MERAVWRTTLILVHLVTSPQALNLSHSLDNSVSAWMSEFSGLVCWNSVPLCVCLVECAVGGDTSVSL